MIKRIVPVSFWSESDVLETYSLEDRLFHVYLMTNQYSSQLGIYKLNKCYIMLETGLDRKTVELLLDRFEHTYQIIAYNHETQEISILKSLEYSIIRGGKPVSDLLTKEITAIKDHDLILKTFEAMLPYWNISKRGFDKIIQNLFINELANRQVAGFELPERNTAPNENKNENDKKKKNDNEKKNDNNKQTQNENENEYDNHKQKSWGHSSNESKKSSDSLKDWQKTLSNDAQLILTFYQENIGDITYDKFKKFTYYLETMTADVITEAIERSKTAGHPYKYCLSILKNWYQSDIQHLGDVIAHDDAFQDTYRLNKLLEPYKDIEMPLITL